MPNVDDRVVRIEFDNAAFAKKMQDTLNQLAQLEKALKFEGASRGLSDLNTSAQKVDFSGLGEGVDGISKKFIAMSAIVFTIFAEITAGAIRAGANIVKAFAIDPVLDGFREYETNLNSIQTILANTDAQGTTLAQVNEALNQLNAYSDKTIYNFAQMARNIGTFTAAGVDLNTSVNAIKGIANLAALSGSSADQASVAMYQLSQAIASGTVKLIDWNSVVNAGMGGTAFQSTLFETGKALGTLTNVPVEQTFQQWKDAGNSFRETLQDGWITADVLTTALGTFTGDMTKEMLLAKGFNDQQADALLRQATIAQQAATQVKTFTQLLGTVKEAVGTGWADTFAIVLGNFEDARTLWTKVNDTIGKFITITSDARNNMLQVWAAFGGRTVLLDALSEAFRNLLEFIEPIKQAFQSIFPPVTARSLLELTYSFARFVALLKPSQNALSAVRSVFQSFFAALSIGWNIIKEGVGFIANLVRSLLGIVGGDVTSGLQKFSTMMSRIQNALVWQGGIKDFFAKLTVALQKPLEWLQKLRDAVTEFFKGWDTTAAGVIEAGAGRIADRFESLSKVGDKISDIWGPIKNALDKVFTEISDWFHELFDKIAAGMNEGDFDAVLDALNTGLLGGIALLLGKWLKGGINIDIGHGIFERIGGAFDQLTETLKTMQLKVKADVIYRIAQAVGILTAAVVALSLIDSAALTKALSAMAVGFSQLLLAFAAVEKMSVGPKGALDFAAVSAGLIELATALLILSVPVLILGKMDLEDLIKGLAGVAVLLTAVAIASKPLSANSKGMIAAGVSITAMATGLLILSVAMKVMSTLSWEDLAKGLIGVAGGLAALVTAVRLMPKAGELARVGTSIFAISSAMLVLSLALKVMASMNWEELGRGLTGVVVALGAMVVAVRLMPPPQELAGVGGAILALAAAMAVMAFSIKTLSGLSWEQLAKGLVGIAVAMGIMVVAANSMEAAIPGAGAIVIVAGAMVILAKAIQMVGKLSWGDLIKGLVGLSVAVLLIAAASVGLSEAIPLIAALGGALIIFGAGLFLVTAAVYLFVKSLEVFVNMTAETLERLPDIAEAIGKMIPYLMKGAAEGIVEVIKVFTKAAPVIAKALGTLLEHLIDTLIRLTPKFAELISKMLEEGIKIIYKYTRPLIDAGIHVILSLLKGIKKNIGKFVDLVADIVVNFLDAFAEETPRVVDSLVNTITTWFLETARGMGEIAGTLLAGIGQAFIEGLISGIDSQTDGFMSKILAIPGQVLSWIGDVLGTLWQKGIDIITGFLNGIAAGAVAVWNFFIGLPGAILGLLGGALTWLWQIGWNVLKGLWNGMHDVFQDVKEWLGKIPDKIIDALKSVAGGAIGWLVDIGKRIIEGLWNGMKDMWDSAKGWLGGLKDSALDTLGSAFGINSPAKKMIPTGSSISEGILLGMQRGWKDVEAWMLDRDLSNNIDTSTIATMSSVIADAVASVQDMPEFQPTITPVLDLTKVAQDAGGISSLIGSSDVSLSSSFGSAQTIARGNREKERIKNPKDHQGKHHGDLNFEQNIYAPEPLDAKAVYKQTRNQIQLAKEEMSIP